MATHAELTRACNGSAEPENAFILRSYQQEMVEASLKRNIIVAMHTGSGKTHIAVARAAAALENCQPGQLVWFLAPTTTLCQQQYTVFQDNLPQYQCRTFLGQDNVDRWSSQNIWHAALHNVSIAISTPMVLLDTLMHGFVGMGKLALLIFDEAHHCTRQHPTNQIMQERYHPRLRRGEKVPDILGLSASPVINDSPNALKVIEGNLASVAVTPKVHRSEMLRHTQIPKISTVPFPVAQPDHKARSGLLQRLEGICSYSRQNILEDPWVAEKGERLAAQPDDAALKRKYDAVLLSRKTHCQEQLKTLLKKSSDLQIELGAWATDWYIQKCVASFERSVHNPDQEIFDLTAREKSYLVSMLRDLLTSEMSPLLDSATTSKYDLLRDTLRSCTPQGFRGIIFVQQRATAAVLTQMLALDPLVPDHFCIGSFVGESSYSKRKAMIGELVNPKEQQQSLGAFRSGSKNLLITTNVLEEGIDVPECNVVICFEKPANLKSFIQRRGRARKLESKLVLMMPGNPETGLADAAVKWQELEKQMEAVYSDELRSLQDAEFEEDRDEGSEDFKYPVEHTGALLTLANAVPHLHHFCNTLQSGSYVHNKPQCGFEKLEGAVSATITLPLSVDASVRTAESSRPWRSQRAARAEAAFQAYVALHKAGLVNDNLLPHYEPVVETPIANVPDQRPGIVMVATRLDVWQGFRQNITSASHDWHRYRICIVKQGSSERLPHSLEMDLVLPVSLPVVSFFPLYWNHSATYHASLAYQNNLHIDIEKAATWRDFTWHLLRSIYRSRMGDRIKALPFYFLETSKLSVEQDPLGGTRTAVELLKKESTIDQGVGLIRLQGQPAHPFILREVRDECLVVSSFPKRRDFLHPVPLQDNQNEAYAKCIELSLAECEVDNMPLEYSMFAAFIPSIINKVEQSLLAQELQRTILSSVEMRHDLLVEATCAPSAQERFNYQRLEFLGDAALNLYTSLNLAARHLNWHEGYLTSEKGRLVSNGYLSKAALQLGIDRFISTEVFTGAKWRPASLDDIDTHTNQDLGLRTMSTKTLADVVEALIGAAACDGGPWGAERCIHIFMSDEPWISLLEVQSLLYEAAPVRTITSQFETIESLVGHAFTRRSLLVEALTHPSYSPSRDDSTASYERLEFLGDAVLGYIVTTRLFAIQPPLSEMQMHTYQEAVVNGPLLGFLCLEHSSSECQNIITTNSNDEANVVPTEIFKSIWQYMRHSEGQLVYDRHAIIKRHEERHQEVKQALRHGTEYPWVALLHLDPTKYFSDLIESIVGAIYVDSKGDLSSCEQFLERLGVLPLLERLVRDRVDCVHPKERLGILAGSETVEYFVDRPQDKSEALNKTGEPSAPTHRNKSRVYVAIGGRKVGDTAEGSNRKIAEAQAAWSAVQLLRASHNGGVSSGDERAADMPSQE